MAKLSQKSLTARVYKFIKEGGLVKSNEKVLVAVSGGPDSVCLFDILDELKDKLNIKLAVIHYNHKQRGVDSEKDQKFVEQLAKKRGVDCFVGQNNKLKKKLSEAEARELRYAFFEKILGEWSGERLVIAHTANDQAETLLLRLIRGASIFGLSSIPLQRKKISRPLLKFSRSEVLEHLLSKKLKYRLDKSNANLDYSRNLIRNQIIPKLVKLNNQAVKNIVASTNVATSQSLLLSELVDKEYEKIVIPAGSNHLSFKAEKMRSLSPLLIVEVIRTGIDKLDMLDNVTTKHLEAVVEMITKNIGAKEIIIGEHLQVSLKSGIITIRKVTERKYEQSK